MSRNALFRLIAVVFVSLTMFGGGQVAAQESNDTWFVFALARVPFLGATCANGAQYVYVVFEGPTPDEIALQAFNVDTPEWSMDAPWFLPSQMVDAHEGGFILDHPFNSVTVSLFYGATEHVMTIEAPGCDEGYAQTLQIPTEGHGVEEPPIESKPAVSENSFTLTTAERICADQTFNASWSGSNVTSLEFALSNTSDNWTSGWMSANPAAGAFSTAIDHENYDKAVARATFTDGTTQQVDMDTNICAESAAPVPVDPVIPVDPVVPETNANSGSSSGTGNTVAVTSLPSTGAGTTSGSMAVTIALMTAAAMALIMIPSGIALGVRRRR